MKRTDEQMRQDALHNLETLIKKRGLALLSGSMITLPPDACQLMILLIRQLLLYHQGRCPK